jgi:hypothetical protein
MTQCQNCGQPLTESAERFCNHCGAPIPPRRNPTWPLITVAAVAVVLIVGAVVFFVLRPVKSVSTASPVPVVTSTTGVPRPFLGGGVQSGPATTSSDPTSSSSETPTSTTPASDPASVVQAFYDAINNRDYQTAWQLGGQNLGHSFADFSNGFAGTIHDDVTVTGVNGNIVSVSLVAQQTDGKLHNYAGSYTVQNGQILHGSMKPAG